ncbi:MAG: aldose 1-epimerase family protein [Acidimicrobiales bacterium]
MTTTEERQPKDEAPAGAQVELAFHDQRAHVVEVGGAVRAYTAGDRPLLDGYGAAERCTGARGQSLIPWPNRLRDGRYTFGGLDHQLPLTEPARQNAIHGLVRWANWTVAEQDRARVTMAHTLHPRDGWPFTLGLRIAYELGEDGLSVRTTATNLGGGPCPYGAGAHPYLTLGTGSIDELSLRAPGTRWMRTDDRMIPEGLEPVDQSSYDWREHRVIGSTVLDVGYADLDRGPDGLAKVELVHGQSGATVELWMDRAYEYLMLFTGDSLDEPGRRRKGLGVEPMTCAPNALQSGDGLRTLPPGQSFTSAWGIRATAL